MSKCDIISTVYITIQHSVVFTPRQFKTMCIVIYIIGSLMGDGKHYTNGDKFILTQTVIVKISILRSARDGI